MATLQKTFYDVVKSLLGFWNWLRFRFIRSIGGSNNLTIIPYISFGSDEVIHVNGRILHDYTVRPATNEDTRWNNLRNTLRRFNSQEAPGVPITIAYGEKSIDSQTDDEGFFHASLPGNDDTDSYWRTYTVTTHLKNDDIVLDARCLVPPPTARLAVISDLDDTVIRTDVRRVAQLVENILFKNAMTRLPFAGVAEFYDSLVEGTTSDRNPIFYVSNGPWNLYDIVLEFLSINEIPHGPIFLRDFGPSSGYFIGNSFHKAQVIRRLLDFYPDLSFILIGDSGEHDGDIYYEIAREYTDRIKAIYIRDINPLRISKYDQRILPLIDRAKEVGVDMLLVKNSYEAAYHSYTKGYITEQSLETIRQAVEKTT